MTDATRRGFLATSTAALCVPMALPALAQSSEVNEMSIGATDAPVTVIEYASFTCPHCATFHAGVLEQLKSAYVETGKVQFLHREVFFDRFGLWASMVARCGDETRYFGIADMIYAQQQQWILRDDPAGTAENLRRIGRTAGLTDEMLEACLTNADQAQALVAWSEANMAEHSIRATPSFVIDGTTYSNMSFADFAEILDGQLAERG